MTTRNTHTSESPDHPLPWHTVVLPSGSENIVQLPEKEEIERFKQETTLSLDEIQGHRVTIPLWFEKRKHRITASGIYYKGPQEQQHLQYYT